MTTPQIFEVPEFDPRAGELFQKTLTRVCVVCVCPPYGGVILKGLNA